MYIITYRQSITLDTLESDRYVLLPGKHWIIAETEYLSYPSNERVDVLRKFRREIVETREANHQKCVVSLLNIS